MRSVLRAAPVVALAAAMVGATALAGALAGAPAPAAADRALQDSEPTFNETYGGQFADSGAAVVELDGDYALAGSSNRSGRSDTVADAVVRRIAANGTVIWTERIDRAGIQQPTDLARTSDGGLIVVGVVGEGDNTDGFAARLGGDGTLRWYRTYGTDGGESLDGVVAVGDGFAYAGSTAREGSSPRAWLVRVDNNGVQQFARTYERQPSAANDIVRAGDGYVIAGEITRSVRRQSDRHTDAWAARLAANGNVRWTSSFGTEANNESAAAVASVGDGYVLAGRNQPRTEDGDDDPSERRGWYAGTTGDGDERWTRTYGDRRAAFSDVVASNESLVLVGRLGQRSDADLTAVRVENSDGEATDAFVSETEGSAIAQRGLLRGDRVAIAGTLLGEADSQTWLLELPVPGSTGTPTPTPTPTTATPTNTNTTTTATPTTSAPTTTTPTTPTTTTSAGTTTAPTTGTSTTASTTGGTGTADPGGLPVPGFTVGAAVLAVIVGALLAARRR